MGLLGWSELLSNDPADIALPGGIVHNGLQFDGLASLCYNKKLGYQIAELLITYWDGYG
jgi:hypothetical protein